MTKKQRAENRLIDELAKRKIITSYQGSLEQFAVDNFKAGYAAAPAYEKQLSVSDFFNSIRELLDEARDWWHRQCSADKNKELLEKYYHEGELLSDEKIINMFLMEEKREFAAAPAYKGYENLETKAAIFLEEMHISGDTMVAMDHSLDDVPEEEQGSLYLHDIMSLFVESLTPTQPNSVQEGDGWIRVEDGLPERPEKKQYQNVQCGYFTPKNKFIQFIGFYAEKHKVPFEDYDNDEDNYDPVEEAHGTMYLKEGWYELVETPSGEYDEVYMKRTVTHWQPLPAPPQQ